MTDPDRTRVEGGGGAVSGVGMGDAETGGYRAVSDRIEVDCEPERCKRNAGASGVVADGCGLVVVDHHAGVDVDEDGGRNGSAVAGAEWVLESGGRAFRILKSAEREGVLECDGAWEREWE